MKPVTFEYFVRCQRTTTKSVIKILASMAKKRGKDETYMSSSNICIGASSGRRGWVAGGVTPRELLSPCLPCVIRSWRLVVYSYYITAAGNAVSSQLSSSCLGQTVLSAQGPGPVHHSIKSLLPGQSLPTKLGRTPCRTSPPFIIIPAPDKVYTMNLEENMDIGI